MFTFPPISPGPPYGPLDPRQALASPWRTLSTCFAAAFVTGLFGALARRLRLRDALLAAGVSGAAGLVVGSLAMAAWPDRPYLIFAACGLSGWAGGNVVLDRLSFVAWSLLRGYALPNAECRMPNEPPSGNRQSAIGNPGNGYADLDLPSLPPRRKPIAATPGPSQP